MKRWLLSFCNIFVVIGAALISDYTCPYQWVWSAIQASVSGNAKLIVSCYSH